MAKQRAGLWLAVEWKEEEGVVGRRRRKRRRKRASCALWCIVGRRLQLPCRCAAWLSPASGRQPITAQGSSATSVQCVRANRGGKRRKRDGGGRYRDVRKTRGGSKEEGMEEADRERRMTEGHGTGRRQKEKWDGEALQPYLQIAAYSLHHFYSFKHFKSLCVYCMWNKNLFISLVLTK